MKKDCMFSGVRIETNEPFSGGDQRLEANTKYTIKLSRPDLFGPLNSWMDLDIFVGKNGMGCNKLIKEICKKYRDLYVSGVLDKSNYTSLKDLVLYGFTVDYDSKEIIVNITKMQ